MTDNRYTNKPVLLLLENYVLDCLGELGDEERERTAELVGKIFRNDGEWRGVLQLELGLQPSLADQLKVMWVSSQDTAKKANVELNPKDFAQMVVDENFGEMVEMVSAAVDPAPKE